MNSVVAVLGTLFVVLATAIHLLIFVLESVLWHKTRVQKLFGVRSAAEAATIQPWAYNQGFYNAFLAVGAATGLVMMASVNLWPAGIALALFAAASMVLAAAVLITSQPKLARAAAIQGVPPLLGILFLVLALTVS
jgi:putative membrane protein